MLVQRDLLEDIKEELNTTFDELGDVLNPVGEVKREDGFICQDLVNIDLNKIRLKSAKLFAIIDELNNIEPYSPENA